MLFHLTKLFEDWRHALGRQIFVVEVDVLIARVVCGNIYALRTVHAILETHAGAIIVHKEKGRSVALFWMQAHGNASLEQFISLLVGHHAFVRQLFQHGLNAV